MLRFALVYFHASIPQEDIEIALLSQSTIDFDCQGIHHSKRVYFIKARKESDINNVHRLERHMNHYNDELFKWMTE